VRQRLAQKMEFLTDDITGAAEPDEAALEKFFAENAARYARPARTTFRHVYFSPEKRGADAEPAAREALAALGNGGDEETMGDAFLHGFGFAEREAEDLAALFGPDFPARIAPLPVDAWQGPVASSYGLHLVRIEARADDGGGERGQLGGIEGIGNGGGHREWGQRESLPPRIMRLAKGRINPLLRAMRLFLLAVLLALALMLPFLLWNDTFTELFGSPEALGRYGNVAWAAGIVLLLRSDPRRPHRIDGLGAFRPPRLRPLQEAPDPRHPFPAGYPANGGVVDSPRPRDARVVEVLASSGSPTDKRSRSSPHFASIANLTQPTNHCISTEQVPMPPRK
jgi:hypothetical protein